MSFLTWITQASGGLAFTVLLVVSYYVISREATVDQDLDDDFQQPERLRSGSGAGILAIIYAYYTLLIHLMVFMFSLRVCWAFWEITIRIKRTARSQSLRSLKSSYRRRGSAASLSSAETLTSSHACSSASSEAGDIDLEKGGPEVDVVASEQVTHAIVIPNYKEDIDILRETLEVLASHPLARSCYDVYIAMEQREVNGDIKAMTLVQEFVKKFRGIDYTQHPPDLSGEAAGKGSNVAWAARKLSQNYSMRTRKNVIITGIDADSHLSSNYFALVTNMHLNYPETAMTTLYSAPIIFDRNAHQVPALVRVADILWSAAGLSGLYPGSSISPPTSVYSVPLELVDRVGGWDRDSHAIGEDLHMYIKCFFATNGHLTSRTVWSAISQSNVTCGGNTTGVIRLYLELRARYSQALRHMWGSLDSGYAIRKFIELWRNRKQTTRSFRPLHTSIGDESDLYVPENPADAHYFDGSTENGIFSDIVTDNIEKPNWTRLYLLMHRLFEAHFVPVQMTILVLSSAIYLWATEGNGDPHNIAWCFQVSNILRTAGFMMIAFSLFLYESYHRVAVKTREKEMTEAGLAKGMFFSHRNLRQNLVDYFMVPLVAPLYATIPCAQAQISHFWTPDLTYTVSQKFARLKEKLVDDTLV